MSTKLSLEGILNGYVNIVSRVPNNLQDLPKNTIVVPGQFFNLDPILQNNLVSEIVFNPILNIIGLNDIKNLLSHWKSKLEKGGTIKIFFADIKKMAKLISDNGEDLSKINMMIFGPSGENRSLFNLGFVKDISKEIGLNIKSISQNNIIVVLELENAN